MKVDSGAQQRNIDRIIKAKAESQEIYDVMYTKHLTQKQKIWEEGLFIYDLKTLKGSLYNDRERNDCTHVIDTKYLRIKPDFDDDETFRLNKFLVQIEVSGAFFCFDTHILFLVPLR